MDLAWKKIFDLIKKTGEKCLVVDGENQEVYAILKLADYEKLIDRKEAVLDLTEDELLDRINCDIALWQANREDSDDAPIDPSMQPPQMRGKLRAHDGNTKEKEEEEFYIEPVETN